MTLDLTAELTLALKHPTVADALAQRMLPILAQALRDHETDGLLRSEQVALLIGYKRADGAPNMAAFKAFRNRHPGFATLGTKIGRRWHWRRSTVLRWLDERSSRPNP